MLMIIISLWYEVYMRNVRGTTIEFPKKLYEEIVELAQKKTSSFSQVVREAVIAGLPALKK